MVQGGIGAAMKRKEDVRFLTGKGTYVDDIVRPGQTWAVFVRSPHAHARIVAVRTEAARKAPGVVAILTGADLAADKVGILPAGWLIHSKDGTPMKEPPHPVLAQGKVRYVGEAVALVVAQTLLQDLLGGVCIAQVPRNERCIDRAALPGTFVLPRDFLGNQVDFLLGASVEDVGMLRLAGLPMIIQPNHGH